MKGMGVDGAWIELRLPRADEPAVLIYHDSTGAETDPREYPSGFVFIRWWDPPDHPVCLSCGFDPMTGEKKV